MKNYSEHYAGGSFRKSTGALRLPLVNPSTREQFGAVVSCSPSDIDRAVHWARAAFDSWSQVPLEERIDALNRLRAELAALESPAVASLAEDIGCPVWLGRLMQMPMALKDLELTTAGARQIQWQEQIGNGVVERVPSGVLVAITPWNFPIHQIVAKVAAAIAAGCTVVLKPSEVAPGVALLFAQAVEAAKLPPGVFNLVWGGAEVGEQLVRHRDIDRISFTGSTQVGRRIMAAAAEGLKPITLELGGKSAAVLLEDAQLDVAIPAVVRMSLANTGQTCVCQSRLIAPRHLMPEIRGRIHEALAGWPMGLPQDEATRLGPVATEGQYTRVQTMVKRAIEQGARLIAEGGHFSTDLPPGFFVPPTVFEDVHPEMALAQEEVFGPVLAVMPYHDEEQAVQFVNSTRYGLSGAVWSADASRGESFARRMNTGQVILNGAQQNLATPFGGWGLSGFGRENGRFGIEELLNYRSLHGAVI